MNNTQTQKLNWLERPIHLALPAITIETALFAGIILLAIVTRFYDLESRVMSHDESLHTYFSWLLYRGQGFQHTPMMHGPWQFHWIALSYFLFGVSDFTARIPAALFSIATVAMVWPWRRYLGGTGALIFTILSLATGGWMVYAQAQGLVNSGYDSFDSSPLVTWIVSLLLFPVSAVLQHLGTRVVRNALTRARASEARYRLISQVSSDYTFSTELDADGNMKLNWAAGAFEKITGVNNIQDVVFMDQSPPSRSSKSVPATYLKFFDEIRQLLAATNEARKHRLTPSDFSFNIPGGRCEACEGDGVIAVEMHFLPDMYIVCDVCHGTRYNRETLEVHFRGKNIAHVLDLTVNEALQFFGDIPAVRPWLETLRDVGLDYLRLGQPAPTLSGGEAQRIALSNALGSHLVDIVAPLPQSRREVRGVVSVAGGLVYLWNAAPNRARGLHWTILPAHMLSIWTPLWFRGPK